MVDMMNVVSWRSGLLTLLFISRLLAWVGGCPKEDVGDIGPGERISGFIGGGSCLKLSTDWLLGGPWEHIYIIIP